MRRCRVLYISPLKHLRSTSSGTFADHWLASVRLQSAGLANPTSAWRCVQATPRLRSDDSLIATSGHPHHHSRIAFLLLTRAHVNRYVVSTQSSSMRFTRLATKRGAIWPCRSNVWITCFEQPPAQRIGLSARPFVLSMR